MKVVWAEIFPYVHSCHFHVHICGINWSLLLYPGYILVASQPAMLSYMKQQVHCLVLTEASCARSARHQSSKLLIIECTFVVVHIKSTATTFLDSSMCLLQCRWLPPNLSADVISFSLNRFLLHNCICLGSWFMLQRVPRMMNHL